MVSSIGMNHTFWDPNSILAPRPTAIGEILGGGLSDRRFYTGKTEDQTCAFSKCFRAEALEETRILKL